MHQLFLRAKKLPNTFGCYLFKEDDCIIYIGKANNLQKRVLSYFKESDRKTSRILQRANQLDFFITANETEALVLENNLIKNHQPLYNIKLKDDQSYPYLAITQDPFPQIFYTKKNHKNNVLYIGPFPEKKLYSIITMLDEYLKLRKCTLKEFIKRKDVCDQYHLGFCSGPCFYKEQPYEKNIQLVKDFFLEKNSKLLTVIEKDMYTKASLEKFEEAEFIKQLYFKLKDFQEKSFSQSVENISTKDVDLFCVEYFQGYTLARLHCFQSGKLTHHHEFYYYTKEPIEEVLRKHYSVSKQPFHLYSQQSLDFTFFKKTPKKLLILEKNFQETLEKDLKIRLQEYNPQEALLKIQELLKLTYTPLVIEGFDVAVFQGSSPTASLVTFKEGFPAKESYKYFHLKELPEGNNDFKMLEEVFNRRLLQKPYPDIFLIDGGLPQWLVMKKCQHFHDVHIPFLAIAKARKEKEERIILNEQTTYLLKDFFHLSKLLMQIRDESHRFARKLHHKKESKRYFKS